MVSLDAAEENARFAASLGAELPVISDPRGRVARAYGVLGPGGLYSKRWTFYIDATGRIREIDREVSPATAGRDMVRKLGELGFARSGSGRAIESPASTD
jgi:peroxiredoxin Q/BCP